MSSDVVIFADEDIRAVVVNVSVRSRVVDIIPDDVIPDEASKGRGAVNLVASERSRSVG